MVGDIGEPATSVCRSTELQAARKRDETISKNSIVFDCYVFIKMTFIPAFRYSIHFISRFMKRSYKTDGNKIRRYHTIPEGLESPLTNYSSLISLVNDHSPYFLGQLLDLP